MASLMDTLLGREYYPLEPLSSWSQLALRVPGIVPDWYHWVCLNVVLSGTTGSVLMLSSLVPLGLS